MFVFSFTSFILSFSSDLGGILIENLTLASYYFFPNFKFSKFEKISNWSIQYFALQLMLKNQRQAFVSRPRPGDGPLPKPVGTSPLLEWFFQIRLSEIDDDEDEEDEEVNISLSLSPPLVLWMFRSKTGRFWRIREGWGERSRIRHGLPPPSTLFHGSSSSAVSRLVNV